MQKQSTKKIAGSETRAAGSHLYGQADRKGQNGSTETRGRHDDLGEYGLSVLARSLRTIPFFEADVLRGGENTEEDEIKDRDHEMFGTEAKQLQAIEDLYGVLKAQPAYKKIKEPSWNADTLPFQVITWLLKRLGRLAQGRRWTCTEYKVKGRSRYAFSIYEYFHSQKVMPRSFHQCLDFLPTLEQKDKPLHDLFVDTIALVSKNCHIPFWDEDGDFEIEYRKLIKEVKSLPSDYVRMNTKERQTWIYSWGPAARYLRLLKQRRHDVTPQHIYSKMSRYKFVSQRQRFARGLFRWALKLKGNMRDYTLIPAHRPNAVTPYRLYKFVWSDSKHDIVESKAWKRLEHDQNHSGRYLPVRYITSKPGQVFDKFPETDKFPEDLCQWLRWFEVVLFGAGQRDYYYKDYYDSSETPTERYIEWIQKQKRKEQNKKKK